MKLIKQITFILLFVLVGSVQNIYSQDRTCGMQEHMEQLLSDPAFAEEYQRRQAEFELFNAQSRAACTNTILLPVAVHFQNVSAANMNRPCLEALALDQIRILNEDYQGINADISNWTNNTSQYFAGASNGESCIEFCLPTMGHPTSSGLVNGTDYAVTINISSNDSAPGFGGYINIFVRNIGALGYSPLGGNGGANSGVTIDNNAFGTTAAGCGGFTASGPYNRGRTLTHELGHYLNLNHIWGNGTGCGTSDLVADTPTQSMERYGCPNHPVASCSSNDMSMNYMDYVNDACMYMFSAGQVTRMENYVNNQLQNVINKGNQICTSASTCPSFLNETVNINSGTQQIEAINYITSESDITGTANIQYNAGDYVELRGGFVAETPATFCAIIQACVPFTTHEQSDNLTDGDNDNGSIGDAISNSSSEAQITIYNKFGSILIDKQKIHSDDLQERINELKQNKTYFFLIEDNEEQRVGKFIMLNNDNK